MLRPSQAPSPSGVPAISGTRAGAPIGMAAVATTIGADMDLTPIPDTSVVRAIVVGMAITVGTATMVGTAITVVRAITEVLAVTVDPVVLAATADRCGHQLTELI